MPSAYLKYAVDFGGEGRRDLIHNTADALASTANFLQGHGWRRGAGWDEGQPNFEALLEWNKAHVYSRTIALFADRRAAAAEELRPNVPGAVHPLSRGVAGQSGSARGLPQAH